MKFPKVVTVLYGQCRRIGQCGKSVSAPFAGAEKPMTHLSWDESAPCVLAWRWFVTRLGAVKPGHASQARLPNKAMENTG
jgi:hypothetical protein